MKGRVSPSTGRRYPLTMICQVYQVARSSLYAARASTPRPAKPGKRGPKTVVSNVDLITAIRNFFPPQAS